MSTANTLAQIVSAVAPINGVGGPYPSGTVVPGWSLFPDSAGELWNISFQPSATITQQQAAQTAVAAFNPNGPRATAQSTFDAALASGLTMTWTASTALNDTYPIDTATQVRMLAERLSVSVNGTFTNGTNQLTWYSSAGTQHSMSMTQAGLFVRAVWQYLTALFVARATALGGGTPTWPSPNITITG